VKQGARPRSSIVVLAPPITSASPRQQTGASATTTPPHLAVPLSRFPDSPKSAASLAPSESDASPVISDYASLLSPPAGGTSSRALGISALSFNSGIDSKPGTRVVATSTSDLFASSSSSRSSKIKEFHDRKAEAVVEEPSSRPVSLNPSSNFFQTKSIGEKRIVAEEWDVGGESFLGGSGSDAVPSGDDGGWVAGGGRRSNGGILDLFAVCGVDEDEDTMSSDLREPTGAKQQESTLNSAYDDGRNYRHLAL
jgi:hypothetical protein